MPLLPALPRSSRFPWLVRLVAIVCLWLTGAVAPRLHTAIAQSEAVPVAQAPVVTDAIFLPLVARSWQRPEKEPESIELVGQLGGDVTAVALAGDDAFVGIGPRLVVLDIADPAHPRQVGRSDLLPDIVADIAVAGGFAHLAAGEGGLITIDVRDRANPRIVDRARVPNAATGVDVADGVVHVAYRQERVSPDWGEASGFMTFAVDEQGRTLPMGGLLLDPTEGMVAYVANDLDVEGGFVYVACANRGYSPGPGALWIVDVSTPRDPTTRAILATDGNAEDVVVVGTHAYVATNLHGVRVADVTDPSAPQWLSTAELGTAYPRHLAVAGGIAVVNTQYWGLAVYDVSRPESPRLLHFERDEAFGGSVALEDHRLYAATRDRLRVVDLADPAAPVEIGSIDPPSGGGGVRIVGQTAWLSDSDGGLYAIDISDPTNPIEMGRASVAGIPRDVDVAGRLAVVVTAEYAVSGSIGCFNGHIEVFDVGDPRALVRVGEVALSCGAWRVDVVDRYAYLAAWDDGLVVIDLADPAAPRVVAVRPIPWGAHDVAVAGDRAFLAAGTMQEYDIADPTNPKRLTVEPSAGGPVHDLSMAYPLAYLWAQADGLHIADVSVPGAPRALGTLTSLDSFSRGAVDGGDALGAGTGFLMHLDVSDPAAPRHLSTLRWPVLEYPTDIALSGDIALVASETAGLVAVRLK